MPDEPVELPIEDSLDLHSFRPQDVRSVVDEYLIEQQAVVDRPGRLPDHSTVPIGLAPSDLPAADPARAHL